MYCTLRHFDSSDLILRRGAIKILTETSKCIFLVDPQCTIWSEGPANTEVAHQDIAEPIVQIKSEVSPVQSSSDLVEAQIAAALRLNLNKIPHLSRNDP